MQRIAAKVDAAATLPANTGKGKTAKGSAAPPAPPKPKPDSYDKQWADRLLSGASRVWFADAPQTSGAETIYKWNGSYLQHIAAPEGNAIVAKWLDTAAPDRASAKQAVACWNFGGMRLRSESPLPQQKMSRNLIPCADVYLDMDANGRIMAIAPHPSHGLTYALKIACGTKVGAEHITKALPEDSRFRRFIKSALPDADVRDLVQEQCGLTLLPANYQIAAWWVGAAGSGKSTLAELCKAMQRQVANACLEKLGERFGLESLVGASLIVVDEVEAEKWCEAVFKSAVGGNGLSIDRKNEKGLVDFSLKAKWIITSNAPPFVRDKSNGVWRRLCVVRFDNVIPEGVRVTDYHQVLLAEEGQLILDWMLEGAKRIVMRGCFLPEEQRPVQVQQVKEDARNDCDSVRGWVTSCRVSVSGEWQSKDLVFNHYESWCSQSHQTPLERRTFWKGLRVLLKDLKTKNKRVGDKTPHFANVAWLGPEVASFSANVTQLVPPTKSGDEIGEFFDDLMPSMAVVASGRKS
jgi:P4 family phage/plasmid primase-like protien